MKYLLTAVCAGLVALPLAAQANSGKVASEKGVTKASSTNANQRAADLMNTVNQDEVAEGEWVQNHATNDDVKNYAKELTSDHEDAQKQLESVAGQNSLQLQTVASVHQSDQAQLQKLQKEPQATMDKTFAANEVKDHSQAIAKLEKLEPQITDPSLKSMADNEVSTMQKHMKDGQKLESQLGVNPTGTPGAKARPAGTPHA